MGSVPMQTGHPIEVSAGVEGVELVVPKLDNRLESSAARRLAVCLLEAAADVDNPRTADWP